MAYNVYYFILIIKKLSLRNSPITEPINYQTLSNGGENNSIVVVQNNFKWSLILGQVGGPKMTPNIGSYRVKIVGNGR